MTKLDRQIVRQWKLTKQRDDEKNPRSLRWSLNYLIMALELYGSNKSISINKILKTP